MGPDDSQRRQLRLALSMNGGVSLAVWIAGAVAEIDEMRRGVGFWGDLLEAAGYRRAAQVDVMSGASAGGLNAVMLSVSIQANSPFDAFFPLWLDAGDIDQLVKPPNKALALDRRAVLNGHYFLEQLHEALVRTQQAAVGPAPEHALAVFASATLVRANPVAFRDVPGEAIHENRSDAYFHVARRGPASRGLDGFVDSEGAVPNLRALAMIGRATSSLPGLFEPMTFHHESFGSRLVGAFRDDRDTVEIMDGGVIDNVPVARAVRAIFHVPATGRTRRVLLYLHPDPGGDSQDRAAPDPRTAVTVGLSARGKNKETIRDDIELLRQHNDAVRRRDVQARLALERLLAGAKEPPSSVVGQVRAVIAATLLRAALDPASELPWHAPARPRVTPLVDAPDSRLTKDELAAAFRDVADGDPNVLVADRTHRTVAALQRVVRMAEEEVPSLDLGVPLHGLNDLQLLCHLVTSFQLGAMLTGPATTVDEPVDRLTASCKQLSVFTLAPGPDDAVWRGLASWAMPPAEPAGRPLVSELERLLDRTLADVPAVPGDGLGCRVLRWLTEQPQRATAAREIGDALLDLRAEPVASDQHIDFVRIAGNVETWASKRFTGPEPAANRRRFGDRIAGKQLHHLGAFFDRRWRENDLRWGRLDSAPALIESVLDDEALGTLRAHPTYLPEDLRGAERDTVTAWLVEQRQSQLLDDFAKDEPFDEWRKHDRRLVSLVGGRHLTSSAMQGVITAAKVGSRGLSRPVRAILLVLRPLFLAAAGIVLAGRWATAALAWTVCVLAATRQADGQERWWWWYAGSLACVAIAGFVETKLKPVRTVWRVVPPYALTTTGILLGAVFLSNAGWLDSARPSAEIRWVWLLPALAAAMAALSLLYWTAVGTAVVLSLAVGAWYGWIAYAAYNPAGASPWPHEWPFHSIWLAWLVAIVAVPVIVGRLPKGSISPRAPRT